MSQQQGGQNGTTGGQGAIPYMPPRQEMEYICAGKLFGI